MLLVCWIDHEFEENHVKGNHKGSFTRKFFYENYLQSMKLKELKKYAAISEQIAFDDHKLFTKVYLNTNYRLLYEQCKVDIVFKSHLLMIKTCLYLINDQNLNPVYF